MNNNYHNSSFVGGRNIKPINGMIVNATEQHGLSSAGRELVQGGEKANTATNLTRGLRRARGEIAECVCGDGSHRQGIVHLLARQRARAKRKCVLSLHNKVETSEHRLGCQCGLGDVLHPTQQAQHTISVLAREKESESGKEREQESEKARDRETEREM